MNTLSRAEVQDLIHQATAPCVSIFMPTHAAGPDMRQNPIRFKNLIREAEERLVAMDMRPEAARQLLQPATEIDQPDFWRHQSQGLAIFVAPDFWRYYHLPIQVEELVVVADQFQLQPLLSLLTGNERFYILTLNQQQIRFLEATSYGARELQLPDIPQSLDEALQYDETAKTGQFRISTSRGGTANPAQQPGTFHGQGSPDRDTLNRDILQFFHQVDAGLHEYLRDKRAPLVIAGVESLLPLYQEANTYPQLLETGLAKNVEGLKPEDLQAEVWPIVQPHFEQARQEAVELYQQLSDTNRVSDRLTEIVPAAYFQRVQVLFTASGHHCWGRFDPLTSEVHLHGEPEPGDNDLLDFAALHTFLNDGEVYVVAADQIPQGRAIAAVFRYSTSA